MSVKRTPAQEFSRKIMVFTEAASAVYTSAEAAPEEKDAIRKAVCILTRLTPQFADALLRRNTEKDTK